MGRDAIYRLESVTIYGFVDSACPFPTLNHLLAIFRSNCISGHIEDNKIRPKSKKKPERRV